MHADADDTIIPVVFFPDTLPEVLRAMVILLQAAPDHDHGTPPPTYLILPFRLTHLPIGDIPLNLRGIQTLALVGASAFPAFEAAVSQQFKDCRQEDGSFGFCYRVNLRDGFYSLRKKAIAGEGDYYLLTRECTLPSNLRF
jgi:hypothetical protein